ncbi:hypothetical protein ACW9UM_17275 [Marinovum sp. KMM 9989]
MPVTCWVSADDGLVIKTFRGHVTRTEILEVLDALEENPAYAEGMVEFDDMRDVTHLDLTDKDIRGFADLITSLNQRQRQPSRKAILTPDGAPRRAAELYSAAVAGVPGFEMAVMSTLDEALRYLRLEDSALGQRLKDRTPLDATGK